MFNGRHFHGGHFQGILITCCSWLGKCQSVRGFISGISWLVWHYCIPMWIYSLFDVSGPAVCIEKDSSHDSRLRLLKRRKLSLADPSPCEGGCHWAAVSGITKGAGAFVEISPSRGRWSPNVNSSYQPCRYFVCPMTYCSSHQHEAFRPSESWWFELPSK